MFSRKKSANKLNCFKFATTVESVSPLIGQAVKKQEPQPGAAVREDLVGKRPGNVFSGVDWTSTAPRN